MQDCDCQTEKTVADTAEIVAVFDLLPGIYRGLEVKKGRVKGDQDMNPDLSQWCRQRVTKV